MQRVRLHKQSLKLHPIVELAQGSDLTAGIGGIYALGDRHAQAVGVGIHLSDRMGSPSSVYSDRPPQGLAITDKGVDRVCHARLGRDPLLQQGLKTLHIQLSEQQPEGGVRRWLGDIGAK